MKFFIAIFLFAFVGAQSVLALTIPDQPQSHVNDYAHVLQPNTVDVLNRTLSAFELNTSTQIVVAVFPSLEGESLEDFTLRLAEKWRVGQKGVDNGVVLSIFIWDRKMRIEVGYGHEERLTDLKAARIVSQVIAPHFKKAAYDDGVIAGIDAIVQVIQGEEPVALKKKLEGSQKAFSLWMVPLMLFIFVWLNTLIGFHRRTIGLHRTSRGFWFGSVGSGFSGGSFGGGGFGGFSGGGGGFGGGGASGSW